MIKTLLTYVALCICLLCSGNLHAHLTQDGPVAPDGKVVIGESDSLQSAALGEQRKFFVYVPEKLYPTETFPVLYISDGEKFFISAVGMVNHLSNSWGGNLIPRMIVVGIPQINRTYELTPTRAKADADDAQLRSSGGGAKFLAFIEKELIPYVEKKYPAVPYRTYVGHSFGGLSVMYTMLEKPQLFDNYIALDPSLWWGDHMMLNRLKTELDKTNLTGKSLFVAMANNLPLGMDMNALQQTKEWKDQYMHAKAIWEFNHKVFPHAKTQLRYQTKYYEEDNHNSVTYIGQLDALRWTFDWFNADKIMRVIVDKKTTSETAIATFLHHHKIVSQHLGYEYMMPSYLILRFTERLADRGQPDKALAFFELNVKYYSEDPKAYEALGRFYEKQNNKAKAIELYKTAIKKGAGKNLVEKVGKLEQAN